MGPSSCDQAVGEAVAGTIDGQLEPGQLKAGQCRADQRKAGHLAASAFAKRSKAAEKPENAAAPGRGHSGPRHPTRPVMLGRARHLLRPSERSDVPPFMVMDVVAAAARLEAQGRRIIHMEVGQPAVGAPATAIAAARGALATARLGYTETLGTETLRKRIALAYGEWHGIDLDPARIVVTTGSSAGFILAFLSAFNAGDRVAVALPGYPPYRHILSALGCEAVGIETSAATRWAITPEMLMAAHRKAPLKGVLVASPANPTGTMMTAQGLADLIAAAEGEGIRFISDEIYHGLDYAFVAQTAARLSDSAVIINSFSKYFCMTGWRIGWMVAPEPLVRPLDRLQGNLAVSVPTLSQIAAEAAFDGRAEME